MSNKNQKRSAAHSTQIVEYISSAKILRFVIFVCKYPHVAAATWPCTCLLVVVVIATAVAGLAYMVSQKSPAFCQLPHHFTCTVLSLTCARGVLCP